MKFNLFILPTIPGTYEERERLRPIGRNTISINRLEWFGWYFDQGLLPWDEARRQLDMFAKVIPEFKD